METIQAEKKQKSDKKVVEELLSQYAEYTKTAKESAAEKKLIEQQLLEMSENHTEWFKDKTATFENGQLKFVAISKVVEGDSFNIERLKKKYSHLVKISETLQISKIKPYLEDPRFISEFNLSVESEDKFKVEV